MIRKQVAIVFLIFTFALFVCPAKNVTGKIGVVGNLALSSFGGAESIVGTVSGKVQVGLNSFSTSGNGVMFGLDVEAGLNRSVVDMTRFASIPSGYCVAAGLSVGTSFLNGEVQLKAIPSLREVYFSEQDRWYLQVGGKMESSIYLGKSFFLDGSVGCFWNRGFISYPVSLGVSVGV